MVGGTGLKVFRLAALLHPARLLLTKVGVAINEPYDGMGYVAPVNYTNGGRIEEDAKAEERGVL